MPDHGLPGDANSPPGTLLPGGIDQTGTGNVTQARVTQVAAEALHGGTPKGRVTQVAVEALHAGLPRARVTQVAVETIRDSYVPQTYFPTATTTLQVGLTAPAPGRVHWFVRTATTGLEVGIAIVPVHEVFASATTALELTVRPSGRGVRFFAVGATTGLDLLHAPGVHKVAVASARTGILVGQRGRDAENPNLFIEAATGLALGSLGDYFTTRSYFKNAETLLDLGVAPAYRRDVAATATTAIDLFSSGSGRLPILFASAATGLAIGTAIAVSVPRVLVADAATSVGLFTLPSAINTSKYRFATTAFTLRNQAAKRMNFSFEVRATTTLEVGLRAPDPVELRAYFVAAATGFTLAASAPAAARDRRVSAATTLEVGASAPSVGRDIRVAAITALNLALIEESNQFVAVSSPTGFDLVLIAAAITSGTPADSGLVFTHRADAEVALPWRRRPLTLPPGGQLPHSG
jgi:hypothetical protein